MRTRIMLLPGSEMGEYNCACFERILTDISAAFGHSFSMMRGKGEGGRWPDSVIAQCEESQGILLGDADCPAAGALYDALDLPLRVRSICVPEALCARHEAPSRIYIGTVLSLDQETLRRALQCAFAFAREEDARILHIAPTGSASREEWEAGIRVQCACNPLLPVDAAAAPDMVKALVRQPNRLGLILCPPYAGSILDAAATALCAHPEIVFDSVLDEDMAVFAPYVPPMEEAEVFSPLAAALAASRMLRASLHLPREAACLDAAIENVLANQAFGAAQQSEQNTIDLICEQIAVAGELMGKGSLG